MTNDERLKRNQEEYRRRTGRELILLDASTFQRRLHELSETLRSLVEREGHRCSGPYFMHADIAMTLKYIRAVYDFLFYLNADERIEGDPTYNQAYSFSFLPLIRTIIDGFYNVTAMLDDTSRAVLFRTSGYRNRVEAAAHNANRYGTDRSWLQYAEDVKRQVSLDARRIGIPESEINTSKKWPTLGKYLASEPRHTPHKSFLRALTFGHWRQYSSISHASFEGLHEIAIFLSRSEIAHERRSDVRSMGERVVTQHMARASGILISLLTELEHYYRFDTCNIPRRLEEIWDALCQIPEINELYQIRYKQLMVSLSRLEQS